MHEMMHPIKIRIMQKNHEHDAQAPIAPFIGNYFIIDQIKLMQGRCNDQNPTILKIAKMIMGKPILSSKMPTKTVLATV